MGSPVQLIIPLLMGVVLTVVEAQGQGSFSFPENCNQNSCMFTASWLSLPGGMADFTVSAKVIKTKWAGIGFSNNGFMIGSDAVVGWVTNDDIPILQDRFLIAKSPNQVPVDQMQDITIKAVTQDNDMLKYSFSRPLVSPDSNFDINLSSCIFLIFAWGGNGNSDGSITQHTMQMATPERICFDDIPLLSIPPMIPSASMKTTMTPTTTKDSTFPTVLPVTEAKKEAVENVVSSVSKTTMSPPDMSKETTISPPDMSKVVSTEKSCRTRICPPKSKCVMELGLPRCYCLPQYPMDKYGNCGGGSVKPKPPMTHDKCSNVQCHDKHSKCHEGKCICKYGFHYKDSSCQPSTNKPHFDDKCMNNKCSEYEICAHGFCICKTGYKETIEGCKMISDEKVDKCKHIKCSENAECELGYCKCMGGYKLDHGSCRRHGSMMDKRKCGHGYCAEHAECHFGRLCRCKHGYKKTPHNTCILLSSNPCRNVKCPPYHSCSVKSGRAFCVGSSQNFNMYSCMGKCGKYNYTGRCSCNISCLRMGACCRDFAKYCMGMHGNPFHGR